MLMSFDHSGLQGMSSAFLKVAEGAKADGRAADLVGKASCLTAADAICAHKCGEQCLDVRPVVAGVHAFGQGRFGCALASGAGQSVKMIVGDDRLDRRNINNLVDMGVGLASLKLMTTVLTIRRNQVDSLSIRHMAAMGALVTGLSAFLFAAASLLTTAFPGVWIVAGERLVAVG